MSSFDKVGILGVPLGFGAGQTGSELGVNAMRLTRFRGLSLAEHIQHLGLAVRDHGDAVIVQPESHGDGRNPKHLAEMLSSSVNIAAVLSAVLSDGEFPIILGGDHAIAIPTFSAIANSLQAAGNRDRPDLV